MLEAHVHEILRRLKPTDLVLDVGGWACPFNRAQWIFDAQPYETRGFYRTFGGPPSQGPPEEWFTRETWVVRDICEHTPWPFADKQFDFVICSHTLEDVRDPLWVCSELIRVGKAGYIEVPSRAWESTLGHERPGQAGLSHHRWLIEIEQQHIRFIQKYHAIHADWRFSLPERYRRRLKPEESVTWLWWTDSFSYEEVQIHGLEAMERELMAFVQRVDPRPAWCYVLDEKRRQLQRLPQRIRDSLIRILRA